MIKSLRSAMLVLFQAPKHWKVAFDHRGLCMSDRLNAWLVLDRAWRSAISALWRFPLLLLLCWLGDVLALAYASRILPAAANDDWAARIFDQAAYLCLHTLFVAPLMTAMMLMVIKGRVQYSDLRLKPTVLVGIFDLGRGILYLALLVPFWFWSFYDVGLVGRMYLQGAHFSALALWTVSRNLWHFLAMLLWARLAMMLPAAALGNGSPKPALVHGWRMMKGHYRFALVATMMAIVPFLVLENILSTYISRHLASPDVVLTQLTLRQWERFMIRSGEVMFRCLLDGALAGWLYRAILARETSKQHLDTLPSKGTVVPFSPGVKAQ